MSKIDLAKLGIISDASTSKAAHIFEAVVPMYTVEEFRNLFPKPSSFVQMMWDEFDTQSDSGIRGKLFEYLISSTLIFSGIQPFYREAQLPLVPNVKFDLIMYEEGRGPIALSVKTSLRERYKQADLEAMALRTVFRHSKTYLITMNAAESVKQQEKLEEGNLAALDQILLATSAEFDVLIADLANRKLVKSPTFDFVSEPEKIIPFHGHKR